jgi:gas vesicle protein
MSKMDTKDFVLGAVLGSIIGAAVAILMAPKSGKELRTDLNEKAVTAKDRTTEWSNTAKEKGVEWTNTAKEKGTAWKSTAKEKGTEYSQTAKEKSEEFTTAAKQQLERISEKSAGVKQKASSVKEDLAGDVKGIMESEKSEGRKLAQQVVQEIEETKARLRKDVEALHEEQNK